MEFIIKAVFVLAVIVGSIMLTRDVLVPEVRSTPATASLLDAQSVAVAGTLTYDRNNAGALVPYVVYKTSPDDTETKALAFDEASRCVTSRGEYPCALIDGALPTYYGPAVIAVTGTIVHEHINVDSVTFVQ